MKNKTDWKYYLKQIASYALPLLADRDNIARKLDEVVHFKRIMKKYAMLMVMVFVSFFLVLNGLSLFLESVFPQLRPGVFSIILGIGLLVVAFVYKSYYKVR